MSNIFLTEDKFIEAVAEIKNSSFIGLGSLSTMVDKVLLKERVYLIVDNYQLFSNFSNSNIFGIPLSSTYIPSSVYGFASYWVNGQCPFTMPTMTGTATAIPWYYLK